MDDRDGLGCSVLALVAAVAVVAFLLGRASVGWFADPPRQPVAVATAAAGQPVSVLAASPEAVRPSPATPTPSPTPRPVATPQAALPSPPLRPSPSSPTPPATGSPTARPASGPPAAATAAPQRNRADAARPATPRAATPGATANRRGDRPGCDPSYPTVCIPPPPPNGDCSLTTERNFPVRPPDPHGLDSDNDGVGCEPVGSP